MFKNTSKILKTLKLGFWTTKICLVWFGQKNIQKGLLREFFGLKFILRILGRPEQSIHFFVFFSLPAPSLVMTKGLLTFAGPQNAQNNDFFMYTKKGQIWKFLTESEKSTLEALFQTKKKFSRELFMYSLVPSHMGDKIVKSKNLCCQLVVFPSFSLLNWGNWNSGYVKLGIRWAEWNKDDEFSTDI